MRRFVEDESGMTMALSVIMIVLIGVMGAGLLTFVSRDLESVIEVNQGQRAHEMANAGLEAAKYQLSIVDALPSSYDSVVTAGNSVWYDNGTPGSGKTLTLDGNQIVVGIRHLPPPSNTTQARQPDYAPEMLPTYYLPSGGVDQCTDANGDGLDDDFNLNTNPPDYDACNYENNRNYFRVTARGNSGNAVRAVQAIYQAENFGAVPLSNYASRDIDFNGNATTILNMSIFANRDLLNFRAENITGTDYAYGDWATIPGSGGAPNLYNATPRRDAAGNPVTVAGAGFVGSITYDPGGNEANPCSGLPTTDARQKAKCATPQRYGYRDYDANTDLSPISQPEFTTNTWGALASQPTTMPGAKMTFPFAPPGSASDDAQALAVLKEKAQAQGLYKRATPGSTFTIGTDAPVYPGNSDLKNTVMFIEFANGTDDNPVYSTKGKAIYKAQSTNPDGKVKGIIVVVNGNLDTSPSADTFQGAMVIRDPNDTDTIGAGSAINCNSTSTSFMYFCNSGNVTMEGYVNIEGDMKLGGNISGLLPSELFTGLPSLVKVSRWSWRECYNEACN